MNSNLKKVTKMKKLTKNQQKSEMSLSVTPSKVLFCRSCPIKLLDWNLKRSWQKFISWQKWQSWQKWRIGQNATEIRILVVGDAVTSIFCKSCQTVLLDLNMKKVNKNEKVTKRLQKI